MKITVFNLKRESVGELELSDDVFGTEVKEPLLYEVVKAQLASRRSGTKATKERSAVSGSSKKLYKQKGTGRARQGSLRAPHHAGGGMAHALEPKDWSYRPPRKVRQCAQERALALRQRRAPHGAREFRPRRDQDQVASRDSVDAQGGTQVARRATRRRTTSSCAPSGTPKITSFCRPKESTSTISSGTTIWSSRGNAAKALEARCLGQAASKA